MSPVVGIVTAICCFFAARYKYLLRVDEGLDIFAIHGVGGYVGDILTGIFADKYVPALDGVSGDSFLGGGWNGHWRQVGLQFAGATTCAAWSFFVSLVLLFAISKIPGMHLRASESVEVLGLDYAYLDDAVWDSEEGQIIQTTGEPLYGRHGSNQSAASDSAPRKGEKQP